METKKKQNTSEIFNSFVNTIRTDKDVLSTIVLIETKVDRLIHVEGEAKDIARSLFELCKAVPQIKHVLEVVLLILEEEKQEKVTDESN